MFRVTLKDKNGFMKFDSPILSGNAAEDSTELFETDYFGTPAYLSQSGQLYLEAGAMALGRVFDFGSVFRAEKSLILGKTIFANLSKKS